jgi:predicted O-methyltransferase YrrM
VALARLLPYMTTTRSWHGVLSGTDDCASHPANIDVACMLASFVQPKVVVEAGTYSGHFLFAMANILCTIGQGKVYSADLTDRVTPLLAETPSLLPHIVFHHGDFLEMLATVPDPIDFAYIDASSTEDEHMRWEHATVVFPRLSPGGLMLVDDTGSEDWADAKKFREWTTNSIHLPQYRGLTIIQKEQ